MKRNRTRVYFIKPVGMDGPIKIGCSISPESRKSALDTWSPFALEILAEIDGSQWLERRFHAAFIHLHQRREWFDPAPELLATIEQIKAGTFDTDSLPEPRRVSTLNNKRPPWTSRQLSYSLRVAYTERRTGYAPTIPCWNMVRDGDQERIASIEAYLADPVTHGRPLLGHPALVGKAA